MQIEWTRPALGNLARLVEFLVERSPTAAERAKTTIGNATRQLKQFPTSGRPYPDDPRLRELLIPFGHYGYSMLYRVESQVVVITNLKHQLEDRY